MVILKINVLKYEMKSKEKGSNALPLPTRARQGVMISRIEINCRPSLLLLHVRLLCHFVQVAFVRKLHHLS